MDRRSSGGLTERKRPRWNEGASRNERSNHVLTQILPSEARPRPATSHIANQPTDDTPERGDAA